MRRSVLAFLLLALPAAAQSPPVCSPAREGQVACMAGKLCECRFERGGQMTGRPDRFAWDCGVMRPMCPPDPNIVAPGMPPVGGVVVEPQWRGQVSPQPYPQPQRPLAPGR
ncbi:hypothetical protein J5Y09_10465 [Roseomonas sp. PWR1]|uniref:Uncharacterized protein n=1 Tax=Roseomonas nitratireducens TaxID=2820810 RepID=A0ABS4AUV7_9PROT|nr:hypothetical protein [Neoroseomonas nitratireducens]MBP0464337.1 hypothetical protein [Neoroseomonas nitratireducens]